MFVVTITTYAQDSTSDEKIIERYKLMLSRKPKEGSTFDRLYQFYLEGAGLDAMVTDYQNDAQQKPDDANAQLILGHIYKRLGKDTEAITAYQRAAELAPNTYYPHFALGKMYSVLRQHEQAIGALEKASSLVENTQDIPPEELISIYKALGHAYFRRDNVDEAIQAWKKISELDPKDIFARIELADLFREQELYDQAIAQYEAIIELKKDDPYRICLSHREIGNIHELKGEYDEAINRFDTALSLTAQGNWLRKDLQHRIIGIFAADSNWEGLIEYYQGKLESTPNEPELLGLLAAAYIENQQLDDGISTYRKGLELAPTDSNLRLSLIASLRNAEMFADAANEYEVLKEQDPDDFGIYRELGELYLQLGNQEKAKAIYTQMMNRDPQNPNTYLILAEIYTGHDWIEEAITQYEKAISLAPDNPDYIEYFGDFYFRQANREKALETWNRMVAGDKATDGNYDQLAQLLKAKNFKTQAIDAIRKAVELMPNEYRYHETLANYLLENQEYDEALIEFTEAMKLAPNMFFAEKMDDKRIDLYRHQGTLLEKIDDLESELENAEMDNAERFSHHKQLAKMYLKLGNITYALEVLMKAKQLKPNDISINRQIAQVYNRQGRRDDANAIYLQLIDIDNANAREYHAKIAQSYLNVMDFDAATTAAKQVIAHSPRNPEGHQLLAQIAKQSKKYDTAIDSLKQAIRLRPEALDTRADLAATYKLSGKLQQSLAQYWRCWELSDTVGDKLSFVQPISEIYYDLGRRGEFEEKLKQLSKSNTTSVAPVLALAELKRLEGDLPNARFQLAQALNKQRENPELLSHLVQISIELGDIQDALTYQQRLVKADPDFIHQQRLGELLFDVGREQEAVQAWTKLLHAKNQTLEAEVKLAALLLRHGLSDEAYTVLDRASEKITGIDAYIPLYRLGIMLVGMNEAERAIPYFHKILNLANNSEQINQQVQKKSDIYSNSDIPGIDINKFEVSRSDISQIQSRPTFTTGGMPWIPKTIEDAQAGALVHLTTIAQQQGKLPQLIQHFETDAKANPNDIKTLETLARLYTLIQYNDKAKETIDTLIDLSPNDVAYQPLRLHRSVQDDLSYKSVKKSLDEIPGLPEETRYRYIAEYALMLNSDDKKQDATQLMSEIEDVDITDPDTAFYVVDAFRVIEKIEHAERILINLPSPTKQNQRQYRLVYDRLTDAYMDQGEIDKALTLLWTYCERTKPQSVNPRRVAALTQSTYYYGGYAPVETTFPTPTVYYNSDRLSFLRSTFKEIWIRNQQETLYQKLHNEINVAEGRDKIYPSLALSYCYWWDGNRDKAQQILAAIQKELPDDLTLKLNTAIVSIQTGNYKDASIMLEELVEAEPRNRMQYYDLLLQLAIQSGDTVSLRNLMGKFLNSQTGAQELYQFSQKLQDAGFTQYAIAAGKKAMTLAMTQRNPNFLMDLAEQLSQLGRGQDAAQLAERAVRFASHPDRYGRMMHAWNFQQATNLLNRSGSKKDRENRLNAELQKNPESFQTHLKLAMYYEGANQVDKAAESYKAALKLQPKDSRTRYRYIQMMERSGKSVDAIPEYTILLKNDSTALGYNYENAIDAFVQAGKLDELISLTKELILPVGKYAGNDFTQKVARRCLTEDRPKDAIEIFEKILQVHPSWNYIHQELAGAYATSGEPEKAIQYLTEKYELGKTSLTQTSFELKLAELHEELGGNEGAIDFLREKTGTDDLSTTQSTVVLKLADYYQENGELENFIKEYEERLAENPTETKLLYILTSMKIKAKDIEGANSHVDTLIDNVLMSFKTQWFYNLADASEEADAHNLQFRLLEAAAQKLESKNSWDMGKCYEKLGKAYADQDMLEKAQNAIRKMGNIQIMRDQVRWEYEKTELAATYMKYKMWDEAEKLYTDIINDLSASSYYRNNAQRQFMEIKRERGDLDAKDQLSKSTTEMNIGIQRAMAQEFVRLNQVEQAVEVYQQIAKRVPDDYESRAELASLYTRLDQHENAHQSWKELLDADPQNTKYQDGLVDSYYAADKTNEAIELAQNYIQAEPEVGVHYIRLAKLYSNEDKLEEAITAYEKGVELAPGDREIYLKMAEIYFLNDDLDATETAYKNAIQFTPSSWQRRNLELKLNNLYRYQGKLADVYRKAKEDGTLTFEMQREWANEVQNSGDLEKAIEEYKKAQEMTTDSYDRNRVGDQLLAVYIELGNLDAAIETYETQSYSNTYSSYIMYTATGISANSEADEARETLISTFKNEGKLDQLKTLYEGKLTEKPNNLAALAILADIYWSEKDYQKAADTYQRLSKAHPNNLKNFYYAAAALKQNKQPDLVEEILKKAEKALASSSQRHDRYYLGTFATICFDNKMYDQAIDFAKSMLESSSGSSGSMYDKMHEMIAKSYRQTKRYEKAVDAYRKFRNAARSDSVRNRIETEIRETAKEGKLYEKWIPEQVKIIEEKPNDVNARLKLAESYEDTGKIDETIEQYQKLTELEPDNIQWYRKLGDLYQLEDLVEDRVIEGTALSLNGNDACVEIVDSEVIDNISDQVTISAWIKPTDFPNSCTTILFKGNYRTPNISHRQFTLWLFDDGSIQFDTSPGGQSGKYAISPKRMIEKNKWYHVAGTIDVGDNSMKVYINGSEVKRNDFRNAKQIRESKLPFRIGCSHEEEISEHASFVGLIDEVRIWNIARTQTQIRADMNQQLNGDEPGLVGYWTFDKETDGVVNDATANNHDGKLIGDAKLESYSRTVYKSMGTQQLAKAKKVYEKVIELKPDSYSNYNLLAKLYMKMDQTNEAEKVYRQALTAPLSQSNHTSAINDILELYPDEGQEEKHINILEEYKSIVDKSGSLQVKLADLYKNAGESEKAELAYTNWVRIREKEVSKQSSSYQRNFANELLEKDLYPEIALKFAKRAFQSYTGAYYSYPTTIANASIANGLYDEAIKNYLYALSITNSDYNRHLLWKGVAETGKKVSDKEGYLQMLNEMLTTIPTKDVINRAYVYRVIAQYYSEHETTEFVENYLLSKTGFIPETRWITLGPFKSIDSQGTLNAFIPEETTQIDTTAQYAGRDGLISWKKSEYRSLDGHYVFVGDNDDSAAYVWAIVISPDERDITMRFGSDDQGLVWLNGKKVFEHFSTSEAQIDSYIIPVTLKQGENTILLKICNSTQSWDFFMRLTDKDGMPYEDLTFKTADELLNAPPPKPTFHIGATLGMVEYYSKNNMPEKAMDLMLQTGIIHENAWQVLGPFDHTADVGYDTAYISEDITQIDTTKVYDGIDGQVSWKKHTDNAFDGFIDLGRKVEDRAAYAWTTVISPEEREVQVRFGSDDQGKVWLNGQYIFGHSGDGWAVLDKDIIPATLKAGENTILVKVCNRKLSWGFYLRITDIDGKPIPELQINQPQEK